MVKPGGAGSNQFEARKLLQHLPPYSGVDKGGNNISLTELPRILCRLWFFQELHFMVFPQGKKAFCFPGFDFKNDNIHRS